MRSSLSLSRISLEPPSPLGGSPLGGSPAGPGERPWGHTSPLGGFPLGGSPAGPGERPWGHNPGPWGRGAMMLGGTAGAMALDPGAYEPPWAHQETPWAHPRTLGPTPGPWGHGGRPPPPGPHGQLCQGSLPPTLPSPLSLAAGSYGYPRQGSARPRTLLRTERLLPWLHRRSPAVQHCSLDLTSSAHDLHGGRFEALLGQLRGLRGLHLLGTADESGQHYEVLGEGRRGPEGRCWAEAGCATVWGGGTRGTGGRG